MEPNTKSLARLRLPRLRRTAAQTENKSYAERGGEEKYFERAKFGTSLLGKVIVPF